MRELDLEKYQDPDDRLAAHVPWDFFVAPGIFRNKDGSLTRCIEFHGRDLDSSEDSDLLGAVTHIAAMMGQFRTRWCHHLEVDRREVRSYPEPTALDPVARAVDEERRVRFRQGGFFQSRFFDSITMAPPPEKLQKLRRFFSKRQVGQRMVDAYRELIEPFARTTGLFAALLDENMAWAKCLDDDETTSFLHACVSPHRHHRVRKTPYPRWPIEADVMDTPFVKGSLPLWVDSRADWHVRTVGILGYPETSYPGMLEALDRLGLEYRFVQRFICLSDADAASIFYKIFKRRNDNKYNWNEYIASKTYDKSIVPEADAVEVRHTQEASAAREEAAYGGMSSGYLTPTVTVWDRNLDALRDKENAVLTAFRDRGFAANVETANAFDAWLSSLPGEFRANVRQSPLPAIHPVNMFPISAPWVGPERNQRVGGPALMVLETAGGTPFRYDSHYGDTGNGIKIAPVRTGKSTNLAVDGVAWQRYEGARVFSLDVDAEFSALAPACLMTGGDVMGIASNPFELQPFAEVGEDKDEFLVWHQWCMNTLDAQGTLAKSRLSVAEASSLVGSALGMVAAQRNPRLRDMDLFHGALQHPDLKAAFADYCGQGPYAPFMNGRRDRISDAHWVTFELTSLVNKPKAVRPILLALLHKIWRRLDGRPTRVHIDEAWLALKEMPDQLDDYLRRLPKRNASLMLATHSLYDISGSSIASVLRENCKTKDFLANAEATSEKGFEVLRGFGLNGQQAKIIANLVPKRDIYHTRPDGARVCQLRMGPLMKVVCGSGGEADARLFRATLAQHGRQGFAAAFLRAKGQHEIANRLERMDHDLAA